MMIQSLTLMVVLATPVAHIAGPTEVQPGWPFYLSSKDSVSDKPLRWSLKKGHVPFSVLKDESTGLPIAFVPAAGEAGSIYEFKLVAIGGDTADAEIHQVRVLGTPKPLPVPVPGSQDVHVIFIVETSANMSREHYNVLMSTSVKEFLDKKTKGWRRWDPDIVLVNESAEWKGMWESAKKAVTTLPAVAIFVGNSGTVYPLPTTEAGLFELLVNKGRQAYKKAG